MAKNETDELTTLLVELGLKDNLTDESKAARAEMRKFRDDLDDLAGRFAKGDAHYSAMKANLEQIRDPARRAAVAQKLLNKQYANQVGLLDKLVDRGKEFQINLQSAGAMGTVASGGLTAAAAGVTALGAAMGAFLVSSGKTYLENSSATMIANQELSDSYKELQMSMGEALLGPPEEAAENISKLTAVTQRLNQEVKENSDDINDWVEGGLDVANIALKGLTATAAAGATPMAALIEGIGMAAGFGVSLAGVIVEELGPALSYMGLVTGETEEEIKDFGEALFETGNMLGSSNLTGELWGARDAVLSFTDSLLDGTDGLEVMRTEVTTLDDELIDFTATLENLSNMDALQFLEELGQASVGPLAEPGESKPKAKKKARRAAAKKKVELSTEDEFFAGGFAGDLETDAMVAEQEAAQRLEAYMRNVREMTAPVANDLAAAAKELQGLDQVLEQAFREQERRNQIVDQGVQNLTMSFVGLTESIISGEVALSDFASVGLKAVGGVFTQMGEAMVGASIATSGLLSLNPVQMAVGGGIMIGAGALMKRGGSALSSDSGSKSAASSTGSAIESVGRQFSEQAEAGEARGETNIFIGPREIRDYIVDTTADAARRHQLDLARSL